MSEGSWEDSKSTLVKSTQSNAGHRSSEYVLAVTKSCFSAELVTEPLLIRLPDHCVGPRRARIEIY